MPHWGTKLPLYENSLMEEWLDMVGVRYFIEHYFDLKTGKCFDDPVSEKSGKLRQNAAALLFRNGFHLAALKHISCSRAVPKETALLAEAIYQIERPYPTKSTL